MWVPRVIVALAGLLVLAMGFVMRKRDSRDVQIRKVEGTVTSVRKEYIQQPGPRPVRVYHLPVVQFRIEDTHETDQDLFRVGDTIQTTLAKEAAPTTSARHLWVWCLGALLIMLSFLL